jgi:hypothetical protein
MSTETRNPIDPFEERLLSELRRVVAERPAPQLTIAPTPSRFTPRRLAMAGGAAGALGLALAVALPSGSGSPDQAWAVSPNPDGTVTVTIETLKDADGLERELIAAGVPADVRYLPAGTECAGDAASGPAPGPAGEAPPLSAPEAGLNESGGEIEGPTTHVERTGPAGAGIPADGEVPEGASVFGMGNTADGSFEFVVTPPADNATVFIRLQEAANPTGAPGVPTRVWMGEGDPAPCEPISPQKR